MQNKRKVYSRNAREILRTSQQLTGKYDNKLYQTRNALPTPTVLHSSIATVGNVNKWHLTRGLCKHGTRMQVAIQTFDREIAGIRNLQLKKRVTLDR